MAQIHLEAGSMSLSREFGECLWKKLRMMVEGQLAHRNRTFTVFCKDWDPEHR